MIGGLYSGHYELARFVIERSLGLIYMLGFIVALNQFPALVGENGLLPVPRFLQQRTMLEAPSVFHWHYSDRTFRWVAWSGIILSVLTVSGLLDSVPIWLYMIIWFLMWVLYLSIVNVGQTFYGFGWESLLLEAGFYCIFLGPLDMATPVLIIWIIRWLVFRVEFGAGLIKMRGDPCWRRLTCMNYHHETQPLPNPLSWYFHRMPQQIHKTETFFNHLVQLGAVWGLFAPQPVASISAACIILSQLYLIVSGNYAWLNWMTLLLAFSGFSDRILTTILPLTVPATSTMPQTYFIIVIIFTLIIIYMSIQPVRNMISPYQMMNFSFNPFHLVNTYGAFGSVTRKRYEIIIEGTNESNPSGDTKWKPYEFKAKPGDPKRRPPQMAPYHIRLDWQMWFAAMTSWHNHSWFLRLIFKLLQNDRPTLDLLKNNPFPEDPPRYIRARLFHYRYTTRHERKQTGNWWKPLYVREYLSPTSLEDSRNFAL